MCRHSIMYVKCWRRRRLIDIIDVSGWQGECDNRHYTVVANSAAIALHQLAALRRGQRELSATLTLQLATRALM